MRHLQKWHGARNDFLIDVPSVDDQWWNAARARAVCDRHGGVGADGLMVAPLDAPLTMTLFNADGSIAEMSGNGLRCLAAAIRRSTNATWDSLEVATLAGVRHVELAMNGSVGTGSVDMGEVRFLETPDGSFGAASIGNPHVVVVDQSRWSDTQREELAAKLSATLGGANVEFMTVLSRDRVSLRVIERGVGWTQACGSGSCVVAALAHRERMCDSDVTVENPGGELRVTLQHSRATLHGPVAFVGDVDWLGV